MEHGEGRMGGAKWLPQAQARFSELAFCGFNPY